MSAREDQQRRRELARIHILKAELKLDREQYEAVLWTIARVESASKLDRHGRQQVIQQLESRTGRPRASRPGEPRTLASRPLLQKIGALLADARREWSYATAVAERVTGKKTLEWCSDGELGKVVAALSIDAKRRHAANIDGAES